MTGCHLVETCNPRDLVLLAPHIGTIQHRPGTEMGSMSNAVPTWLREYTKLSGKEHGALTITVDPILLIAVVVISYTVVALISYTLGHERGFADLHALREKYPITPTTPEANNAPPVPASDRPVNDARRH
jgi:hypothetical protein